MALTITSKTTKEQIANELRALQAKHDEFRKSVIKTALEAKAENGWCDSGFQRAIDTLGLKDSLPKARKRVNLVLDLDLDHESGWDVSDMDESDWANAALDHIRDNYIASYELVSYDVEDAPVDNEN